MTVSIPSPPIRGARQAVGLIGAILCLGAPLTAHAQTCEGEARVVVKVDNLRSLRGEVVIELYPNDHKRFLAPLGRVMRVRMPARQPTTEVCLVAPAPGRYAVVTYHDENNDELFNRSKLGLPNEGFGFSNNVRPLLGAPSLNSVLIDVPAGETAIRVRMRYLGGNERK